MFRKWQRKHYPPWLVGILIVIGVLIETRAPYWSAGRPLPSKMDANQTSVGVAQERTDAGRHDR